MPKLTIDQIPSLTSKQKETLENIHVFPYNIIYDILDPTDDSNINPQIAFKISWIIYDNLSIRSITNIINSMPKEQHTFINNYYKSKYSSDELCRKRPQSDDEIKMYHAVLKYLRQDGVIDSIRYGKKFVPTTSTPTSQTLSYRRLLSVLLSDCKLNSDDDTKHITNVDAEISQILENEEQLKGLKYVLSQMPDKLFAVASTWLYNIADTDAARILSISERTLPKLKDKVIENLLNPINKAFIFEGYSKGLEYSEYVKEQERKNYKQLTDIPVTILYDMCSHPTVIRLKKYINDKSILNVDQIARLSDDELKQALCLKNGAAIIQNVRTAISQIENLCKANKEN